MGDKLDHKGAGEDMGTDEAEAAAEEKPKLNAKAQRLLDALEVEAVDV